MSQPTEFARATLESASAPLSSSTPTPASASIGGAGSSPSAGASAMASTSTSETDGPSLPMEQETDEPALPMEQGTDGLSLPMEQETESSAALSSTSAASTTSAVNDSASAPASPRTVSSYFKKYEKKEDAEKASEPTHISGLGGDSHDEDLSAHATKKKTSSTAPTTLSGLSSSSGLETDLGIEDAFGFLDVPSAAKKADWTANPINFDADSDDEVDESLLMGKAIALSEYLAQPKAQDHEQKETHDVPSTSALSASAKPAAGQSAAATASSGAASTSAATALSSLPTISSLPTLDASPLKSTDPKSLSASKGQKSGNKNDGKEDKEIKEAQERNKHQEDDLNLSILHTIHASHLTELLNPANEASLIELQAIIEYMDRKIKDPLIAKIPQMANEFAEDKQIFEKVVKAVIAARNIGLKGDHFEGTSIPGIAAAQQKNLETFQWWHKQYVRFLEKNPSAGADKGKDKDKSPADKEPSGKKEPSVPAKAAAVLGLGDGSSASSSKSTSSGTSALGLLGEGSPKAPAKRSTNPIGSLLSGPMDLNTDELSLLGNVLGNGLIGDEDEALNRAIEASMADQKPTPAAAAAPAPAKKPADKPKPTLAEQIKRQRQELDKLLQEIAEDERKLEIEYLAFTSSKINKEEDLEKRIAVLQHDLHELDARIADLTKTTQSGFARDSDAQALAKAEAEHAEKLKELKSALAAQDHLQRDSASKQKQLDVKKQKIAEAKARLLSLSTRHDTTFVYLTTPRLSPSNTPGSTSEPVSATSGSSVASTVSGSSPGTSTVTSPTGSPVFGPLSPSLSAPVPFPGPETSTPLFAASYFGASFSSNPSVAQTARTKDDEKGLKRT